MTSQVDRIEAFIESWGRRLRWPTTIVAAAMALAGCSRGTPYDRLCRIYEDYRGQASTPELAMVVAQRVEKEIPEIVPEYGFLANANVGDRYELLRTLARDKAKQDDWRCDEIRKWYPPASSR